MDSGCRRGEASRLIRSLMRMADEDFKEQKKHTVVVQVALKNIRFEDRGHGG